LGWLHGVGGRLLAKLVSSSVLRAGEPILEASMELAGKLARVGSQVAASMLWAGARCQVAGFDGPLPGLPHAGLGWPGAASLRCLADQGAIADADGMRAG
jgi:hypothetical protein